MKTSMFEKGIPKLPHASAFALGLLLSFAGCGFVGGLSDDNVPEGDRCNPYSSHNDCGDGFVCAGASPSPVTIPFCAENYCCSVDSNGNLNSSNANCQPGCNGGAASICGANKDPGACAFADGASLQAALGFDDAGATE